MRRRRGEARNRESGKMEKVEAESSVRKKRRRKKIEKVKGFYINITSNMLYYRFHTQTLNITAHTSCLEL